MIQLRDKETGSLLGSITEEDLQFLIDQLVEESKEDKDYYVNRATIDMLKKRGGDDTLLELLTRALGDREEMEVEWKRT
ncbi:MAG: galactosyldiacylglycerol synthase [Candidatus Krumholzibacteria bacterium]|nr:galactosyldiacylglycerol synthase [Candidatus Krumholzibacteria bacterium]